MEKKKIRTTIKDQEKKIETYVCGGAAAVRRRSCDGSVVEQGQFLLSLYACLCVFEDNGRKRKENVWMIERKKGKILFRNTITIFLQ